ncbi:MAG: leucine-rich repeat domain-containing protein [Paludibacteraceae bacterium]|nr:leucine-rich repeat domain-containing protein [Paludibacteraceae bacterium]
MKTKILSLFVAIIATATLWASNTITYMATEKLDGYYGSLDVGTTTFGPAITSHTFSNGTGTITCNGEITTIGEDAFNNCRGLTSVTIPNSVTTIGEQAFYWCEGVTSITIPNSVTTIGNDAFMYCLGLTSVTIPNSVTTIGQSAFRSCVELTSVSIGNSVKTIEGCAFMYCRSLISITIPNSVTTIGSSAFTECTDLTSVTIGNSITRIESWTFENCTYLKTVTLGKSLTDIGCNAFKGDFRIEEITSYAEVTPNVCTSTFDGLSKQYIYLYVPENSIRAYQVDPNWNGFDIRTKAADKKPIDGDNPIVTPTNQDVTITWPITDDTDTYTLTITKNGEVVCVLTFNANGQLTNIAFAAPGHNGAHQAPAATLTAQGFQFTVTGLNPGTAYNYSVTATDAEGKTLAEHKGNFSTTGGESDLQNVRNGAKASKYFHNGNLIIERNGVKYTPAGQKVR